MILSLPFPPVFSCWTQTCLREFAFFNTGYECMTTDSPRWFFSLDIFLFCFVHCAFIVWNCRGELIITRRVKFIDLSGKIHSLYTFMYMFPVSVSAWCLVAWRTRHTQVKFNSVFLYTITIIFSLKESWKKWEKREE